MTYFLAWVFCSTTSSSSSLLSSSDSVSIFLRSPFIWPTWLSWNKHKIQISQWWQNWHNTLHLKRRQAWTVDTNQVISDSTFWAQWGATNWLFLCADSNDWSWTSQCDPSRYWITVWRVCIYLLWWGILHVFFSSIDIFFKLTFSKYSCRNTIRMSHSLDHKCLQRLLTHNTCRQRVKRMHFARFGGTHSFYNDKETYKYLALKGLQ